MLLCVRCYCFRATKLSVRCAAGLPTKVSKPSRTFFVISAKVP